jgi:SHS2 domain-containing protein
MERYRILDHPADGKFRAFGSTLEEAFGNAALAVAGQMWDWAALRPRTAVPVEIAGRDLPQLLVKFLEEILYLFETRRFLLGAVDGIAIADTESGHTLRAVFRGETVSDGVEIFGDVKAVTYHEMRIEAACDHWMVQVVVDR